MYFYLRIENNILSRKKITIHNSKWSFYCSVEKNFHCPLQYLAVKKQKKKQKTMSGEHDDDNDDDEKKEENKIMK